MDEKELREKIAYIVSYHDAIQIGDLSYLKAAAILALFREAGYKSPEEVEKRIDNERRATVDDILSFFPEGWEFPLGFNQLVAKIKKEAK